MADIADIVTRLEALLGPASGEPVPLEGGITNRNYRVRFGDGDYVVRLPGKDTALLGISRQAEREANVPPSVEVGEGVEVNVFGEWVAGVVAREPIRPEGGAGARVGSVTASVVGTARYSQQTFHTCRDCSPAARCRDARAA